MKKFFIRSFCLLLVVSQVFIVQANVFEAWDGFKKSCAYIAWKLRYYTPYVVAPVAGAAVSSIINKKAGALCVAAYAGYATFTGMRMIYRIRQRYQKKDYAQYGWHNNVTNTLFYFARWRQHNEGDGIYWTTAWQLNEEKELVKKAFLNDMYAGKFIIINNQGQLVAAPTPQQVFQVIRQELQELAHDKELLSSYTDVFYAISQPEEFHPDVSYTALLWPNYNAASYTYIELDVMMKRLEKLLDIVAELRAVVGGHGWPKMLK